MQSTILNLPVDYIYQKYSFSLTLIGKANCLIFNFWKTELQRMQAFLKSNSRKKWDMQLCTIICSEYEFQERQTKIQNEFEIKNPENPLILTDSRIYSDLKEYYTRYLQYKLGITEVNKFRSFTKLEVQELIEKETYNTVQSQLKHTEQRQFVHLKFMDIRQNQFFSLIVSINTVDLPYMSALFLNLIKSTTSDKNYLKKEGFSLSETFLHGAHVDVSNLVTGIDGQKFRQELKTLKHDCKGRFSISIKDNDKGQMEQMGLAFFFSEDPSQDTDQSLMLGLGNIVYGYPEIHSFFQNQKENPEANQTKLRVVEAQIYDFEEDHFILQRSENNLFYNPNPIKNKGHIKQYRYDQFEDITSGSSDDSDTDYFSDEEEQVQEQEQEQEQEEKKFHKVAAEKTEENKEEFHFDQDDIIDTFLNEKVKGFLDKSVLNLNISDYRFMKEEKNTYKNITNKYYFYKENNYMYINKIMESSKSYKEEVAHIKKIEKLIPYQLQQVFAYNVKFDPSEKSILFRSGQAMLNDLIELRQQMDIKWYNKQSQLVFIVGKMIQIIKLLAKKDMHISYLSPQRILLNKNYQRTEAYDIKYLDLDDVTFSFKQIHEYNPQYQIPEMEQKMTEISSIEQRVAYTLYSLGRTAQNIMLSSIPGTEGLFENNTENIEKSLIKLKEYYAEELVEVISGLVNLKPVSEIEQQLDQMFFEYIKDHHKLVYYKTSNMDINTLENCLADINNQIQDNQNQENLEKLTDLLEYKCIFLQNKTAKTEEYQQSIQALKEHYENTLLKDQETKKMPENLIQKARHYHIIEKLYIESMNALNIFKEIQKQTEWSIDAESNQLIIDLIEENQQQLQISKKVLVRQKMEIQEELTKKFQKKFEKNKDFQLDYTKQQSLFLEFQIQQGSLNVLNLLQKTFKEQFTKISHEKKTFIRKLDLDTNINSFDNPSNPFGKKKKRQNQQQLFQELDQEILEALKSQPEKLKALNNIQDVMRVQNSNMFRLHIKLAEIYLKEDKIKDAEDNIRAAFQYSGNKQWQNDRNYLLLLHMLDQKCKDLIKKQERYIIQEQQHNNLTFTRNHFKYDDIYFNSLHFNNAAQMKSKLIFKNTPEKYHKVHNHPEEEQQQQENPEEQQNNYNNNGDQQDVIEKGIKIHYKTEQIQNGNENNNNKTKYKLNSSGKRLLNQEEKNRSDVVYYVSMIEQDLPKTGQVSFAFQPVNGYLQQCAIGICHRRKTRTKKLKIREKHLKRQGHGLYMITPIGQELNSTNRDNNLKKLVPFQFGCQDVILCTYDADKSQLIFSKKGNEKVQYTMNLRLDPKENYNIAVSLSQVTKDNQYDKVMVLSQMDKIEELNQVDLMEIENIVEEELQIVCDQAGENTIMFVECLIRMAKFYYQYSLLQLGQEKINQAQQIVLSNGFTDYNDTISFLLKMYQKRTN